MTRAGCRHGAWGQHFFFSPRQPLHSINHMFYSGTLAFMTLFFLGDFLQRPAYYAAYLSNVYASLRLLTFFQDKEYRALLTPPLRRDHSSRFESATANRLLGTKWLVGKDKKKCFRFALAAAFFQHRAGKEGRHRSLLHARRCCSCWMSWFRGAMILRYGTIEGTD